MNKTTKLEIMVIASGRTPTAICKQFRRNKWRWSNEMIKKFIELSILEKRKSTLEKEINELQVDTVSTEAN